MAVFTTGGTEVDGVPDPVLVSTNLARRSALAADLDRAAAERCDVYLTELKAAAIDTVAMRARAEGARVVFIRNRPIGIDDALVKLYEGCLRRSSSTRVTGSLLEGADGAVDLRDRPCAGAGVCARA